MNGPTVVHLMIGTVDNKPLDESILINMLELERRHSVMII